MREATSWSHLLTKGTITFDDFLEALKDVPPEDALEWYGMMLILHSERNYPDFNLDRIQALILGLLTRRTAIETQEMIRRATRKGTPTIPRDAEPSER